MAWQQHAGWTPLDGGDLGYQRTASGGNLNNLQPDTAYHGASPPAYDTSYGSQFVIYSDGYEMNDMSDRRSHLSTTSLLHNKEPSLQKSSINPSVRESVFTQPSKQRRDLSGWKAGVLMCAAVAVTVCLLNVTLTIWAVTNHRVAGGLSYLYTGSCLEVADMSLWIHLGINAMSTLLLSASNYTMQIISSPTRKEVNLAHKNYKWLDIGIPSTRNLRGITWGRIFMWGTLALSSIPLHLMYNTAIFSSLSANAYDYFVVTENFLTSSAVYNDTNTYFANTGVLETMHNNALNGTLVRYDSAACMAEYAVNFVSKVRNVLLVTNDTVSSNDALGGGYWGSSDQVSYAWLCGPSWSSNPYLDSPPSAACTLSIAAESADTWTVAGHVISYCMIETVVEECRLSFSLVIMLIVITANAIKATIMILTFVKLREPTLVTIGDAIASFLDEPDPTTVGICLSTREDIRKGKWKNQPAKQWVPKRHFWFKAASIKRWLTCNILCTVVIGVGIYLLVQGMIGIGIWNVKELYGLGFGTVNASSVVSIAPTGLIATVLFANLPQGILSFLYLMYNGLFSCVLGAHEWSLFAKSRKPLRVTAPIGKQRSTYYLQLPYYYALPLLVMSGALHWLMSQSLFLALVTVFDDTGFEDDSSSISTVGYSCIAILFAIIVGGVAVLAGIINGFRRYDSGIPLVGSCSAAISAACHRPEEDTTASLLPVKWGVVEVDPQTDIGHCSFSSQDVTVPGERFWYAGSNIKQD